MNKKIDSRRANSNNAGAMQQFANPQPVPAPQIDQSHSQSRSNGSPTQSLNNIQKISARLRARNPAIMSMTTSPQMLLPINQRNLSPASYNQLSASQEQVQRSGGIQGNALSVGVNSQNFAPSNFQTLKGNPIHKLANASSGQPAPTNNPVSRDYTNQRKILHKSLNSTGVPQVSKAQTMDSTQMI